MTCLKIHRPPATSDLGQTLADSKKKIAVDLEDLLDTEEQGELLLTTHIQDGTVNHQTVEVQTTYDLMNSVKWDEPTKAISLRTAEALAAGAHQLKPRLQLSLVPGYHGFVWLQFFTRGKELHRITCRCKQVHKVQSGRVPV